MSATLGNQPSVFVSSTIRDFKDLRDALKFWLEEMGFQVQMSEHTDFLRAPEAGTFEACFEAVRASDYYLLLIGHNKGGLFDAKENVSVTQQEYRVADASFNQSGQPKIVAVIRHDVVTALRERAAAGATAGGSTLQDWEFTQRFIQEVRKDDEVKAAVTGSGDHPTANWLGEFRDFRELTSVLRSALAIRGPLPYMAMMEGLRWECSSNLRVLLGKLKGVPDYMHHMINSVRREVMLSNDDFQSANAFVTLTHQQIKRIIMQLTGGFPRPDAFKFDAAQQLISSGSLFDYNRDVDAYEVSPLLESLYKLREEFDLYRLRHPLVMEHQKTFSQAWAQSNQSESDVQVPTIALFGLYSLHDRLHNISRMVLGMLRYIDGMTETIEVQLLPGTPIPEFQKEIERDRATKEDLDRWLKEDNVFLSLGMRDQTEEELKKVGEQEQAIRSVIGNEAWEKIKRDSYERLSKEAGLTEDDDT